MEADLTWGNCFPSRFFSWERETDRERGQDPQWDEAYSILAKIVHTEVFMLENVFSSEWQICSLSLGNASNRAKIFAGINSTDSNSSRLSSCSSREFSSLVLLDFFPVHNFFNIPLPSLPIKFLNSAFELQFSACLGCQKFAVFS